MSIKREKLDDYSGSTNNKTEAAAGGALYLYRVIIRTSEVCHSVVTYINPRLRGLVGGVGKGVSGQRGWVGVLSRGCSLSGEVRPSPPPPRDGHCRGRYASCWNAFLYKATFTCDVCFFKNGINARSLWPSG